MEEVWKDINLSSLEDHHTTNYSRDHDHHHQATNFGGMILQNFLARPFANSPSPAAAAAAAASPSIPANPTTLLNLNSVPALHFLDNSNSILHPRTSTISQVPLEAFASANASGGKRVVPEAENNSTGDRRNKRMIKNRESAARSRSRKQEIGAESSPFGGRECPAQEAAPATASPSSSLQGTQPFTLKLSSKSLQEVGKEQIRVLLVVSSQPISST
ncbi:hypothetical protein RND71_011951 [Anisodus tanguticus]|uniref:BZIP domain-containing protein n=1 Tax=Anisodus tanguticus TaxID=243964 RepID=A0AAE1SCA4_9SOLA|nr:hypothetical protein RND71_011951 [Anisodus tanguticus]